MASIKRIDSIEVTHVKGIEIAKYNCLELIPNKPTLLVAPNGFGKSSRATAFEAMNAKRIDLQKEHYHKADESKLPRVAINYTLDDNRTETKEATNTSNEISSSFDVYVINSQLIPKAKQLKISGTHVATSSIEVRPIVLVSKVPEKTAFKYNYNHEKNTFGKNGKVLPNIASLLANKPFIIRISEEVDFSKQHQVSITNTIDTFKAAVNSQDGSASEILSAVPACHLTALQDVQFLSKIVTILNDSTLSYESEALNYLAALEVSELISRNRAAFKKVVARYEYEIAKTEYQELFGTLRKTWKNIFPKEKKSQLVLEFPKASQISNGERDIICFVALLKQAELRFKKNHCILIIDEIFDYLDDANLVACQYYVTQLISKMKERGRQLFPLILTHLSPGYFRSYYFSDQKVRYLCKTPAVCKDVENILLKREDPSIKDDISKYFLHFRPGSIDLTAQFITLGLPIALAQSTEFRTYAKTQLQKYFSGNNYDPFAVCCAVRLAIEQSVYERLSDSARTPFLETHKTVDKLNYAIEQGLAVAETFFLLGIVYNEALHVRKNQNNVAPICSKLENLVIKGMIQSCVQ